MSRIEKVAAAYREVLAAQTYFKSAEDLAATAENGIHDLCLPDAGGVAAMAAMRKVLEVAGLEPVAPESPDDEGNVLGEVTLERVLVLRLLLLLGEDLVKLDIEDRERAMMVIKATIEEITAAVAATEDECNALGAKLAELLMPAKVAGLAALASGRGGDA